MERRLEALLQDYEKVIAFFDGLSNLHEGSTLADIIRDSSFPNVNLNGAYYFLSDSGSKENQLIRNLFDSFGNLPPEVNVMKELIRRIREDEIDLKPDKNSGWYEYQVYALETLLLPTRGEESNKLLLTQRYKKRMIEAFKAMITTRRETHIRQMPAVGCSSVYDFEMPIFSPRLRVEPSPSYYVRQARGYDFLLNFLESAIGQKALKEIHGLKENGKREMSLWDELHWIRRLYYGLYLVSCEDIGLMPNFLKDEDVDPESCLETATGWIENALEDEDLAVDTRVSVPIAFDQHPKATYLWVDFGVKLIELEAGFAKPPSVKSGGENSE